MNENPSSNTDPSLDGRGAPPATPDPAAEAVPTISFADLGLGPSVLQALSDMGFTGPMHVQAETVPLILEGKDLLVQSRTGSGKTAAFGIPICDRIARADDKFVQALVLLPTRELALQVASELARIAAHSGITVVPVYGGAPMGRQIEQLRAGGQIVCGTPGRILDHLRRGTLKLDKVRCAVLDESDEMLSMGFQEDIEHILDETPAERQTLLFSATVPEGIQRLSRRYMRDPQFVKLSADFVGVHEIRHVYYAIPGGQRENELLRVVAFENPERAIVFCNTREETGRVAEFLRRQGFEAEAISSDLSQSDREKVMGEMRAGRIRFLVATDVAARGIDLEALSHVINYTFPESPEVYIHRTGRTGRAGRHGTAISLIGPTEVGAFYYVKLLYKIRPEERSLPSEAEIRSKREGERILALRARFPEDPGPGWRSLARRLMSSLDGEQLCAALLAEVLAAGTPATPKPTARSSIVSAPAGRPEREGRPFRGEREPRFDRERPAGGEGGRDRERARPGGDRDRPRLRGRDRDRERGPGAREERPAPGEERPAPGEERAASREERPAPGEERAASRDERPAPGEERAASREARPVPREERPAPREERPAPREARPAPREERPAPREARPAPREARSSLSSGQRTEGVTGERAETPSRRERSSEPMPGDSVAPPARLGSDRPVRERPQPPRVPGAAGAPPPGSDSEFWSVWSEEHGEDNPSPSPREIEVPAGFGSPVPASGMPPRERRPDRGMRGERGERSRRSPEIVSLTEPGAARRPAEVGAFTQPPSAFEGPKEGEARLFLNLGRKDDATADEVAALFAELGVKLAPSDIEVMNTHSYVNVPADEAERICNEITGRDRDGRKLSCEPARPRRR